MKPAGAGMLLDCVRMGALMEQVIREAVAPGARNDTVVWIVVVLSGRLEIPFVGRPAAMSAASIAARLGFTRERVSMSIRLLVKTRILRKALKADFQDGRTKAYVLTKEGDKQAAQFHRALVLLEQEIRCAAGIKANARAVDPQRVALGLSAFVPLREDEPLGLDRRRTAGMLRARRGNDGLASLE